MAAASTLRRAAAAAVALLRPSATVAGLHPTTSLHAAASRRALSMVGPGFSFGQRRLLSDVVDKATADEILKEIARIDAAGVQRHAASSKEITDLATKVIAYTEAVSAKSYDKTIDIARTALKVCFLVLVASGFLGGTSFYVIYSAGGAAVSDEARKLLEQKTEEVNRRLEVKLVKMLAELEHGDKDIKAREAALREWEQRLLAREDALNKKKEEVGGNNNKKV